MSYAAILLIPVLILYSKIFDPYDACALHDSQALSLISMFGPYCIFDLYDAYDVMEICEKPAPKLPETHENHENLAMELTSWPAKQGCAHILIGFLPPPKVDGTSLGIFMFISTYQKTTLGRFREATWST